MFDNIKNDLYVSSDGKISFKKTIFLLFANSDFKAVLHYRLNNWLYRHGMKYLAYYFAYRAKIKFGIEISPMANIGPGLRIVHGLGTVIGNESMIGSFCTIYQQVTLGTRNVQCGKADYPIIEDNVIIYAGAKIIGGIHIGRGSIVSANAVILEDVESGTVVGGIPGKVIKYKAP